MTVVANTRSEDTWWCARRAIVACALAILGLVAVVVWAGNDHPVEAPVVAESGTIGEEWAPICPGVTRAEVARGLQLTEATATAIPVDGYSAMVNGLALRNPTTGETRVQAFSRVALDVCSGDYRLRWYQSAD